MSEKVADMEAQDFETKVSALKERVEELTASMTEADKNIKATQKEKVELQKNLDEAANETEKAKSELDNINKSVKAKERFEELSKIKKIEDKDATLAEFADMTDDTFKIVLKYAGEAKNDSNSTENSAEEDDNLDAEKATAALDNAEPEKDASDHQPGNENLDNDNEVALALAHTLTGEKYLENKGGE